MNTIDLYKAIYKDHVAKNYFLGVYARDELPVIRKFPTCFIVNTHKRNQPGEHWLAFYFDENGQGEFFDPVGYHPEIYKLDKYLDNISLSNWKYNNKRLQGFFSNLCGTYCLFFIYYRTRNFSLEEIQNKFSLDYEKNDNLVTNFYLNI